MTRLTRFTDAHAVDLWDTRFRWRSGERLRDRTVDATWQRVAAALGGSGGDGGHWRSRYAAAFGAWQILPDPRLLRRAGTERAVPPLRTPRAALNVGAFVIDAGGARARFDFERFAATAALAVRLLDDAAEAFGVDHGTLRLEVGLIGVADAFASLGVDYLGGDAPPLAQAIARSLALGALQGASRLARERGARGEGGALASLWVSRELPAALADAASNNHRHARLTRVRPQPSLARLANGASDGIEPAWLRPGSMEGVTPQALRAARARIAAAMQAWIDAPIRTRP
ncbi:hypothetical protein J5226_01060 [Lysobacter sp. K5869]|uniref:hypothetical protein n=1 Tax=Lysobacter sp. K5869 TaxID=2820808 RepID=UPI001C05FDC0|nr:hypothetical protein [Lysobacter sp. K5869]QWP77026.1 hypothetical protein J5226_01060 [Lysobacter sp. K5869]